VNLRHILGLCKLLNPLFPWPDINVKVVTFSCIFRNFLFRFRLNVFVPWNEVVVLDPVKLSRTTETGVLIPDLMTPRKPCKDHDFDYMKPLVLATWKHGFQVPVLCPVLKTKLCYVTYKAGPKLVHLRKL
jgi:hypothetical protein